MVRRRVRFTYTPELVTEPIVHELGMRFRVVTNIRRADITRNGAWIVLEVEGEPDDIESGLGWARDRGIRVDPVEGELAT